MEASLEISKLHVRGGFFCRQGADLFVELPVAFFILRCFFFALLRPFFIFCALFFIFCALFFIGLFFAFRFIRFAFPLLILSFQILCIFLSQEDGAILFFLILEFFVQFCLLLEGVEGVWVEPDVAGQGQGAGGLDHFVDRFIFTCGFLVGVFKKASGGRGGRSCASFWACCCRGPSGVLLDCGVIGLYIAFHGTFAGGGRVVGG